MGLRLFLFACNSVQRAMVALAKHPVEASQFCGSQFPSKDTIIYKDSVHFDTMWQINPTEIDTIYKNDTYYHYHNFPRKDNIQNRI
jgi:hypothetical protein